MAVWLEKLWYQQHPLRWWLVPAALLYRMVVAVRRLFLQQLCQRQFQVPIIVVGNLSVGGVGKTPLVIALAQRFRAQGLRVGIVSRGYGAQHTTFPYEVTAASDARQVGDEPVLLAKKTACPVVIAPKRNAAVEFLLRNYDSQIIISDDGLQHYAMGRAIEIVVIDGIRGMGNGWCLPAGPLREPQRRLKEVDFLIVNGGQWPNAFPMMLQPGQLTKLRDHVVVEEPQSLGEVAAVAGIGHPQRFFTTLQQMNITFTPYIFPDHHFFTEDELKFPVKSVVMTEKDAVRCQTFATDNWYYVPVAAIVGDEFWQSLCSHQQLKGLCS